jgi:hypothetical protein
MGTAAEAIERAPTWIIAQGVEGLARPFAEIDLVDRRFDLKEQPQTLRNRLCGFARSIERTCDYPGDWTL